MLPNILNKQIQVIRNTGYFEQDVNSPFFGLWQEEVISFTIEAIVQPSPGDITAILPEGYREKSSYLIITETELFCSEENESNPDLVILYNKKYSILKKKIFDTRLLSHYELIAVESK